MCKILVWNQEIKTRVAKGVYRSTSRQFETYDYYHQINRLIRNSIINSMRNMMIAYMYFLYINIWYPFSFKSWWANDCWFLSYFFGTKIRIWNDEYTFTHQVLTTWTHLSITFSFIRLYASWTCVLVQWLWCRYVIRLSDCKS